MDIGKDLQTAYNDGYKQGIRDFAERIRKSLPQLLMESSYLDVLDEEQWIPASDQLLNGMLEIAEEMLCEMGDTKTEDCTDCKHFVGCERVCHGICDSYEVAR